MSGTGETDFDSIWKEFQKCLVISFTAVVEIRKVRCGWFVSVCGEGWWLL